MKQFKVEITRMNGSKYYKTFSTEVEADKFINAVRPKVLAVGPIEKITTEKDAFSAMLDFAERKSK